DWRGGHPGLGDLRGLNRAERPSNGLSPEIRRRRPRDERFDRREVVMGPRGPLLPGRLDFQRLLQGALPRAQGCLDGGIGECWAACELPGHGLGASANVVVHLVHKTNPCGLLGPNNAWAQEEVGGARLTDEAGEELADRRIWSEP